MNSTKIEINKIYQSIDKVAKKGKDNYVEYFSLVDEMVNKSKFDLFKQTLLIKYNLKVDDLPVQLVKERSWKEILFNTNTSFQDGKKKIFDDNSLYQLGLVYYKEIPRTRIILSDLTGTGGVLTPVVIGGTLSSITITAQGIGYSATPSVTIVGGLTPATASVSVRAGRLYSTSILYPGTYLDQDIKLGIIREVDVYNSPVPENTITNDRYQKFLKNKTTKLEVTPDGSYTTVDFDDWNVNYSYDKNLLSLYREAVEYLLDNLN